MKKRLVAGAAVVAALAVACPEQRRGGGVFEFFGPQDLTPVGDLLFVVDSERDQLSVIDLARSPREMVRAPNPLEPLAIPVLERPLGIVRDVHLDADGAEVGGPYLYVYNPALPQISVVGASRDVLRELLRLDVAGPVTAISARGAADDSGESTLFYATATGAGSTVWRARLPATGLEGATVTPETVLELPAESVNALLALERDGAPLSLVVATRADAGRAGRTFSLDLATGAELPLQFPYPVRMLRTHARTANDPAGRYVFGVMNEQSCAGLQCRGILAVDSSTGALATQDVPRTDADAPMLPIRLGNGVPVAFTVATAQPGRTVGLFAPAEDLDQLPDGGAHPNPNADMTIVGIVGYATGNYQFFNGDRRRVIEGNPLPPSVTGLLYVNAAGGILPFVQPLPDGGHPEEPLLADGGTLPDGGTTLTPYEGILERTFQVANGSVLSEGLGLYYQGQVPGLIDEPLDVTVPPPTTYSVSPGLLAECAPTPSGDPHPDPPSCRRVHVGDFVVLRGCDAEVTVTAVDPAAGQFTTAEPPAGCFATAYTVRAGPDRPYVLRGSESGFVARTRPNWAVHYFRPFYFFPAGFDASGPEADRPALTFETAALPPNIQRDYAFVFVSRSEHLPLFITFSETGIGGTRSNFPGGLAFLPNRPDPESTDGGVIPDTMFVSLPVANVVAELDPSRISVNGINFRNVVFYPLP